MNMLETIKKRRSVRAYKEEQISQEEVKTVLEAGFAAPRALDLKVQFTVIQNKEILEKLSAVTAQAMKMPADFVPIAAVALGYPIGDPFTEKELDIEKNTNYIV